MNPHPRFSVAFLVRPWLGFVPLVNATLLVCLLAGAFLVQAHQPEWAMTGSPGSVVSYRHTTTLLANGDVLVVGATALSSTIRSREDGLPPPSWKRRGLILDWTVQAQAF